MSKSAYIKDLRDFVSATYRSEAKHLTTVLVSEMSGRHTMWEERVEIFQIGDHSPVRCYVWKGTEADPIVIVESATLQNANDAVAYYRSRSDGEATKKG